MHATLQSSDLIDDVQKSEISRSLTLFVILALSVSMSVTQYEAVEPDSATYWILILTAIILPIAGLKHLPRTLVGHGSLLLLFLISAGFWNFVSGDRTAVAQLFLLVWVAAWISADTSRLKIDHLVNVYLGLVIVGIGLFLSTDMNIWGLIPGQTIAEEGVWRVSFFPNIAYTGLLSLAVIMILLRRTGSSFKYRLTLAIAFYFLIFSFVRTALIALVMYLLLLRWFERRPSSARLYWGSLVVGFGINVAIFASPVLFVFLQEMEIVSRLFLRGESQLTVEEIYQQLFRPWLWLEHLKQFWDSPMLMGWGAFEFEDLKQIALIENQVQGDTVSFLTRLLAAYGIPGLLFTCYMILRLRVLAAAGDIWGSACFAPVLFLALQWGSVFHPTDALFVIFLLMAMRGSSAFVETTGWQATSAVPKYQSGLR